MQDFRPKQCRDLRHTRNVWNGIICRDSALRLYFLCFFLFSVFRTFMGMYPQSAPVLKWLCNTIYSDTLKPYYFSETVIIPWKSHTAATLLSTAHDFPHPTQNFLCLFITNTLQVKWLLLGRIQAIWVQAKAFRKQLIASVMKTIAQRS